jgi:hypothetical protein
MLVGPMLFQRAVPGAATSALRVRSRSRTTRCPGASRNGQAARALNHAARAL